MPWKHGKIKFDDGSEYPADFLIEGKNEVWNVKVFKDDGVIEEIDAENFASKLNKTPEQVYPFTYELSD